MARGSRGRAHRGRRQRAVSGASPPRSEAADIRKLGRLGEQPARPVLQADASRQGLPRARNRSHGRVREDAHASPHHGSAPMTRRDDAGVRPGIRRFFVPDAPTPARSTNSLRSELKAHVDARVEFLVARGMPREEAELEAYARFGGDMESAIATLTASATSRDRRMGIYDRFDAWRQ